MARKSPAPRRVRPWTQVRRRRAHRGRAPPNRAPPNRAPPNRAAAVHGAAGRADASSIRAVRLRGYPTQNLLASPPIQGVQFAQARPFAVVMMIQDFAANLGNVEERQLPIQEGAD